MYVFNHPLNMIFICVLLHLIADYVLQGCLASLKQRAWWTAKLEAIRKPEDKTTDIIKAWKLYQYDFICALMCHALMWSLVTFLPLMWKVHPLVFAGIVGGNMIVHAIVDDLKANRCCINLWVDQILHLVQIVATVLIVMY